jgi:hypothetical protein
VLLAAPGWAQPDADRPVITSLLGKPLFANSDPKGTVAAADKRLAEDPDNLDLLLAAARARDVILRFDESIPLYTKGLSRAPNDVRFLRFRGHRYISTRRFADAVKDLEQARRRAPDSFDVMYHLALAYYLQGEFVKAAETYGACLNMPASRATGRLPAGWRSCAGLDDDSKIAIGNWYYAAMRRGGRHRQAAQLLERFHEKMDVKDNSSYLKALLYYKGEKKESDVFVPSELQGNQLVTLGYPIGNFALINGDKAKACSMFEKLLEDRNWAAFGFIAAEVEIAQRRSCPK